jgi:protein-L-isoaspartate(D-aspartate) O-methyltransferase
MDFAILRKRMVQEQLIPRGIEDPRVLEVFSKVERHKFIPEDFRSSSYADYPVSIGEGQTISQPFIVALMTQSLGVNPEDKILEIGTGSGYQAAVLAELAREVHTIERIESLAKRSEALLKDLGYHNISIRVDDGTLGWKEKEPFNKIIITAASPRIPLPLTEQLAEGGKLILPLGEAFSQVLTLVEKKAGRLYQQQICGCVFVPLVGKYGWKN